MDWNHHTQLGKINQDAPPLGSNYSAQSRECKELRTTNGGLLDIGEPMCLKWAKKYPKRENLFLLHARFPSTASGWSKFSPSEAVITDEQCIEAEGVLSDVSMSACRRRPGRN